MINYKYRESREGVRERERQTEYVLVLCDVLYCSRFSSQLQHPDYHGVAGERCVELYNCIYVCTIAHANRQAGRQTDR